MAHAHTLTMRSRLLGWPRRSPWLTLTVLCSTILVVNLDSTVLNVALPTLVRDLNATSSDLQWIVDAYALVFGGLLLAAGSLGDRIGRKRTFVAGLAAFAAGSAWAAFAGSVGMLIAARAGMGIGAALMMPSTLAIIADVFPDGAQRQRAIGVWAGTSGVGFALGPIIGGVLLAHFWWGSIFLINVPIAIAALCCAVVLVPELEESGGAATGCRRGAAFDRRDRAGPVGDHRGPGQWMVVASSGCSRGRRAGGDDRIRGMGALQLASDAEPSLLPRPQLLVRGILDGTGRLRADRFAVRAHAVPAVQPRLLRARRGSAHAADRRGGGRRCTDVGAARAHRWS